MSPSGKSSRIKRAGNRRSSTSPRLLATKYLNMAKKRRNFTDLEADLFEKLHGELGSRWAAIAAKLPGRTDNEVKNYWKTHIKKANPNGFLNNDVRSSDASEIRSKLSSNAGDLLSDNLTLAPNNDCGPGQDVCKDLTFDLATLRAKFGLHDHRDQFSGDPENREDMLWHSMLVDDSVIAPLVIPDPYDEEDMLWLSTCVDEEIVGQSTSVIAPRVIGGGPLPEYSSGTDTIVNDNDEQSNGEICLSLEVIEQHFHMNMDDAVQSLKVSRSTLKRICRKYGIKRWPFQKRRKINNTGHSIESNLSNLMNAPGNRSSKNTSSSSVTVKATYKDDIIKFLLPVSSGLDDLMIKIAKRLNLEPHTFKLKYMDDVRDFVLIACDEDLRDRFDRRLSRQVDCNSTFDVFVFPIGNL